MTFVIFAVPFNRRIILNKHHTMKKFTSILAVCTIALMVLASCNNKSCDKPQPKGITASDVDSVSYVLGYSFGLSLQRDDFGALNLNQIAKGIRDASMKPDAVDQETFYRILNGFMEKKQKVVAEANIAESEKFLEGAKKEEGVQATESGLLYKIDREGNGVKPTALQDTVVVNYEGTLPDGTVFDSSYEREEPAEFPLNGVIAGWGEGLQLVDEGGQITLWIPAELAYGEAVRPGGPIGPNQALKFKVELIQVKPAAEKAE